MKRCTRRPFRKIISKFKVWKHDKFGKTGLKTWTYVNQKWDRTTCLRPMSAYHNHTRIYSIETPRSSIEKRSANQPRSFGLPYLQNCHLRNERLFWVHGEMNWNEVQTNRVNCEVVLEQFDCSALRSNPLWTQKKRYSLTIFTMLPTNILSNLYPTNSKFPQKRVPNPIWCINHCAYDSPNCRTTCYRLSLIDLKCFSRAQRMTNETIVNIWT